jgi:hypothetical protein
MIIKLPRMPFSTMRRHVDLDRTNVSEERVASIFRAEIIRQLRKQ